MMSTPNKQPENGLVIITWIKMWSKLQLYIDEYNKYSDSIHSIIQTEKIAQIDAMYNYSLRETENIRLKSEVMKGRYALLISFILVVVVILSFTIFVLLSKKKEKD